MAIRDLIFKLRGKDQSAAKVLDRTRERLQGISGAAGSVNERFRRASRSAFEFGRVAGAASRAAFSPFRDAIGLFDKQERAQGKVRTAVLRTASAAGFSADELFRQASALQAITRIGDEDILNSVTAQLLTFPRIAGEVFQRAQVAVLDLATVLDGDLKGAAIQLGKALGDPATGLTALTRSGIVFTEAQKAVVKSLVATGREVEAQKLILSEIESIYGGQAQAAAKLGAGPLVQLSNQFGDLREEVGKTMMEALLPAAKALRSLVQGFVSLPEPIKRGVVVASGLTLTLVPLAAILGAVTIGLTAIGGPITVAIAGFIGLSAAAAAVTGAFSDGVTRAEDLRARFGGLAEAGGLVGKALGDAKARMDGYSETAEILHGRLRKVGDRTREARGATVDYGRETAKVNKALALEAKAADKAREAISKLGRAQALQVQILSAVRTAENLFRSERENPNVSFADIVGPVSRQVSIVEGLRTRQAAIEAEAAGLKSASDALIAEAEAIRASLGARSAVARSAGGSARDPAGGDAVQLAGKVARATGELAGFRREMVKTSAASAAMADALSGAFSEMGRSLIDNLRQGKVEFRDFTDVLLRGANRLADRLIDGAFFAIENAIVGMFTTASAASGGGHQPNQLTGAVSSGLSSIFGKAIAGVGSYLGFNRGGDFTVGGAAGIDRNLVPLRLSRGEHVEITPAGKSRSGGTITVNIYAQDVESFRRSRGMVAREMGAALAAAQRKG